jgi:ankyrin repeat protein
MLTAAVVTALLSGFAAAPEGCLHVSSPVQTGQTAPRAPIDQEDQDKLTPLMRASARGDLQAVKALLGKGANPDVQSSVQNVTALMFASYFGHAEVVHALIAKGARVDLKDSIGAAPIDWAAVGGHDEIVKVFEDRRVPLNPFLNMGNMPFWLMDLAAGKRQ